MLSELHLRRRLDRSGAAALYWISFVESDCKVAGEYIVAIGRTLRGQLTTTDVKQHANMVLVDWFSQESSCRATQATLSHLHEQCLMGVRAAKDGQFEEETLLNLLACRDDLESLLVAAQTAQRFAEAALTTDVPGLASFVQYVEAAIKQVDDQADFVIPLKALRTLAESLCSRDKAHLSALADDQTTQWWLMPLAVLAIGDTYKKRMKNCIRKF
ncbi:MAG: hypothetical protein WCW31_04555 [Patescibacteria group bacterium]|jgi:hypothetical protein